MEMYQYCLIVLSLANLVILYLLHGPKQNASGDPWSWSGLTGSNTAVSRLRYRFMVVYVLVITADWLPGSVFYVVYREGHGLPEGTVGKLSATGYAAGALSATFVGSMADRYGRKKACVSCCLISALSHLTVLATDVRILFAGRVMGGVAATLMWTVFEPWLLSELDHLCSSTTTRDEVASQIFALMAVFNGIISVLSGVLSEYLVRLTGSMNSPFVASFFFLVYAARLVVVGWSDNYGESSIDFRKHLFDNVKTLRNAWDVQMKRLAIMIFAFESTLSTIIYFWPSALKATRSEMEPTSSLPFGLIFANFMATMMLGSTTYRLLSAKGAWFTGPRYISRYLLLCSALCLIAIVSSGSVALCFMSLSVFEACVGIYNPMMASLKAQIVSDEHRSQVYGLLRLPTNIYVVLTLLFVRQGDTYRTTSLLISTALLVLGSIVATFDQRDTEVDSTHRP